MHGIYFAKLGLLTDRGIRGPDVDVGTWAALSIGGDTTFTNTLIHYSMFSRKKGI